MLQRKGNSFMNTSIKDFIIIWIVLLVSGCAGVPKVPDAPGSGEASPTETPMLSFVEIQAHQEARDTGEFSANITTIFAIKGYPAVVSLATSRNADDEWSGELCVSFWFFPDALCTEVDGGGFAFTFDGLDDLSNMKHGRPGSDIPKD